jgi:hypothetical protein
MPDHQPTKVSSFLEDVVDIAPAIFIGGVTAWGAKFTWMKCSMAQMWLAKGFYGCLAGFLALSTLFVVAIVGIFFVEMVKDYTSRSKE